MRWTDLIRRNTLLLTRTCAVFALGLPVAAAHAQGPANDNCEGLGGIYLLNGPCSDCTTTCLVDLNGDDTTDAADLGLVLAAWGPCLP